MDTMSAFAMGQANRGKDSMVFDWDKAAGLIKESKCRKASAGLSGDWEYTGGDIFVDGKPDMTDYAYLSSTWATPEIEIDGQRQDCYKMASETDGWDSDTRWPESALEILNAK